MWTLVVASSAVFMCLLDALVVTTALPVLKHSLRSGLPDLEWTVNAYNLSFACLLLAWSAPGLLVMPVAGKLAGRYGNRRFMVTGLLMQAAGLACVAALARPHAGFGELCLPLILAGSGTSLVFPAIASEVVTSVPPARIGIASGTNSALRELGGVFGVAILASVFTRPRVYASASVFAAGFSSALWAGAVLSAAGILAAVAVKRPACPAPQPNPAEVSPQAPALSVN